MIRPDLRLIALDETHNWEIRPQDVPYIDQIVGVYLFDQNELTYPASSTPHYTLYHVENQVRLSKEGLRAWEAEHPTATVGEMEELVDYYEDEPTDEDTMLMSLSQLLPVVKEYLLNETGHEHTYRIIGDPFIHLSDEEYPETGEDLLEERRAYYAANGSL
jgi:hypothetical protein